MTLQLFSISIKALAFLSLLHLTEAVTRSKTKGVQKIINGEEVSLDEHFFVASILRRGVHCCGGSVISTSFILTAAHCVVTKNDTDVPLKELGVSLGHKFWDQGQKYHIDLSIVHRAYVRAKKLFDIAILRTTKTIELGPTISLIRLNPVDFNETVHNVSATVIGWGFQDNQEGLLVTRPSEYVSAVELYIIPWSKCNKIFGNVISKTQLCVTSKDSRGSCNGDSGGPLFAKVHGKDLQIGLVSFGGNCNNTIPEVYTRVSSYYTWIRKNMRKHKFESV